MSLIEAVALGLAACLAGAINAIAGGGTLVTFPALIFLGTPALIANATSTVALVVGNAAGIYGFRSQLAAVRPWLIRFIPVSLAGGFLGSLLLTKTSETVFSRAVPFLILFATILFLAQNVFRRLASAEARVAQPGGRTLWLAMIFQFAVAVYGGYFGAGIGILMLASLGILGLRDIHETNALKNVLGFLINLVASLWFIFSGLIDWPKAGVMILGALLGYYLAAHYSQRIPQHRVRQIIAAIGLTISALLFYRQL